MTPLVIATQYWVNKIHLQSPLVLQVGNVSGLVINVDWHHVESASPLSTVIVMASHIGVIA